MEQYRVVIVSPNNSPHSEAFRELALAVVDAIRANNIFCDLAVNELNPNGINIIFGFHLLGANDIPSHIRYIVYQLEQLSETEGWLQHHPEMLNTIRNAMAVWDYSPENIAFLAERNIEASLIPAGYSSAIHQIPSAEKDIDILFYGSRNDRRGVVLQELLNRGYNVKALFGIYGEERDQWIARAKLVINIHFYEANLFESVRMSYLLSNGVPLLTESSPSYPWEGVPLEMVPYKQLVNRAVELLAKPDLLPSYGEECQQKFKTRYSQNTLIKPYLSL